MQEDGEVLVTNLLLISFKRPKIGRFHFLYWEVRCQGLPTVMGQPIAFWARYLLYPNLTCITFTVEISVACRRHKGDVYIRKFPMPAPGRRNRIPP
jgi:hypothetical protein